MYHICHKCGLPRKQGQEDPDIGYCPCLGQTWFEYEETPRHLEEAIEIALQRREELLKRMTEQGRTSDFIEESLRAYDKIPERRK